MTKEGTSALGQCYDPDYPLSDYSALSLFRNQSLAKHYTGEKSEPTPRSWRDQFGEKGDLLQYFYVAWSTV